MEIEAVVLADGRSLDASVLAVDNDTLLVKLNAYDDEYCAMFPEMQKFKVLSVKVCALQK